jgi:hypothetical protein
MLLACAVLACDSSAPATTAKSEPAKAVDAKVVDAKTDAKVVDAKTDTKVVDAKTDAKVDAKVEVPKPVETPIAEPTTAAPADGGTPPPETPVIGAVAEVTIKPWTTSLHPATWTEKTAPAEAIAFEELLHAGVVGQAGSAWYQVGPTGELVAFTMDPAPTAKLEGRWPDDAWMVQSRTKKEDDFEYMEYRLMKLRGGDRWVPQTYGGNEQWFHPGTGTDETGRGEYDESHISTRSGMLMYADTLTDVTRVAGKHEDPLFAEHRGRPVDFFETGAGKVYMVTFADGAYYVQIQCEDPECVDANIKKLPHAGWSFGRRVSRGKHSVSVLAKSGTIDYVLHHRGKSDGWLLEELPSGERPTSMWDSEEGGLWTLAGEKLRWRDTESVWRDIALPEGLSKPSVALSSDRKTVWLAGDVGGTPKVFTTSANAAKAG